MPNSGDIITLSSLTTTYVDTTGDVMTGTLTISNGAGVTSLSTSGNISSSGSVSASTMSATSFTATSKREFKDNISDFNLSALDILSSVKIVNYCYKSDPDKVNYVGFIADDTTEILSTKTKDKMEISSSIGVLIKAVQELNEEIAYLKKPWWEKIFNKKVN